VDVLCFVSTQFNFGTNSVTSTFSKNCVSPSEGTSVAKIFLSNAKNQNLNKNFSFRQIDVSFILLYSQTGGHHIRFVRVMTMANISNLT
jgi:hypothetical protein